MHVIHFKTHDVQYLVSQNTCYMCMSQIPPTLNLLILVTFFVQLYEFHKQCVPEDSEEKKAFVTSLMDFGVSLKQYNDAFSMNNITM